MLTPRRIAAMPAAKRKKRAPVRKDRITEWVDAEHGVHSYEFHTYMHYVAEMRVVIRKVQKIIADCARRNGLEPLHHQALIQVYGAPERRISVGRLADNLNVSPALASRLVGELESEQLARRLASKEDRRATHVVATAAGVQRLYDIVEDVHREVAAFNSRLLPEQRKAALEVFALYIGVAPAA
jgi:DNA-binding MarR family transcriptional regulator